MALIFSSSSRRCGNVCKRSKGRRCGKQCLRAVGKLTAFPSGRKYLFSIGGAAVFHISIVLFWNIGSPSCYEQSIDGQGNIPGRHQQSPDQDETADHSANNKVQQKQRKGGSQRAARHDPGKHPWDAKRQTAKDEQPYIVGDSIFCADGFENAVQQSRHRHGQHALFEKLFDYFGFRHSQHLHSWFHYISRITMRPGVLQRLSKAPNPRYSKSLLRCRCCSCSFGLSSRASTFWRRVSYSFSSRCIFRSSVCRAALRAESPSSSAFTLSEEGSLVSPAFLISLAAASNKIISLSKPRRNFSLSFDALYRS